MNIHERKFKILLLVLLVCGALLFAFSPFSQGVGDFIKEKIFISKYSDQKDFWLVYPTIKENKKFIKNNPNNHIAYNSLGQGYYGLKAYNQAIDAFLRAVEIVPNNADYWSFLGKVYQAKKVYPLARDAYIEMLKRSPDVPNNYIQLAWLYYFRLDPEKEKAFEVLKQGLKKFPTDKNILFDITRYYLYDKNELEFRKYAPRYLKIDPDQQSIKDSYEKGIQ